MGTNPKGCFLGSMGGRSLVVFQGMKVGFFKFPNELFFWWYGMGVWTKHIGFLFIIYLLLFFLVFFSFVI
jgi:hypothetical protein